MNERNLTSLIGRLNQHVDFSKTDVVTLIGAVSGLERQLKQFTAFNHVHIVERTPELAQALHRKVQNLGLTNVTVYLADFFVIVDQLIAKGCKIGCLDFDGVEKIGNNESKLYKYNKIIPIISYVGSFRGFTKTFDAWARAQKIRKKRRCSTENPRYNLLKHGYRYINEKASHHSINLKGYKGANGAPMFNCVSVSTQYANHLSEVYLCENK